MIGGSVEQYQVLQLYYWQGCPSGGIERTQRLLEYFNHVVGARPELGQCVYGPRVLSGGGGVGLVFVCARCCLVLAAGLVCVRTVRLG